MSATGLEPRTRGEEVGRLNRLARAEAQLSDTAISTVLVRLALCLAEQKKEWDNKKKGDGSRRRAGERSDPTRGGAPGGTGAAAADIETNRGAVLGGEERVEVM